MYVYVYVYISYMKYFQPTETHQDAQDNYIQRHNTDNTTSHSIPNPPAGGRCNNQQPSPNQPHAAEHHPKDRTIHWHILPSDK